MKRKLFSLLMAAAMTASLLVVPAMADKSTTTVKTVYKDLSPNTEIYAVTETPSWDYPYYGAKWEPKGGVLYGRTDLGGTLPNGRYGLINGQAIEEESIISHYYSLNDAYSLEYWSYLYGPVLAKGDHAFLVYLNFSGEGADCPLVTNGTYDAKLTETFQYLSTLSCPVFLRIGGEMNVWTTATTPADFIAAYRHIGDLARSLAPNVALVFSPNFSGATNVDMDSFYPGDQYVDWVGCSLYYNRYANNGDTRWPEFYGVGVYGDAMLNVQQTVNLSKLHKKPVMITEGGSSNSFGGTDNSAWAAERMGKAYSFLTMVYPQIKAIVSSDYSVGWEKTSYVFYNNPVVTAAYDQAIDRNPTFVDKYGDTGDYYTKLSALPTTWEGTMELAAYTYFSDKPTATWYVDGQAVATATEYPYSYTLNADALPSGKHEVKVVFSNGASKAYTFQTKVYTANPSNDKLYVDGQVQNPSVYKINDRNYFMIRDVAALLDGSKAQFEVGYDAQRRCVVVTTGQGYTMTTGELTGPVTGGAKTAMPTNDEIYIDGVKADLTAYKIEGRNYFKLQDLGRALNFAVGYDAATGVTLSGDEDYQG